ncbi:MAG: LPS export ABC transporter ATP-binding protein [Gammaproteobacteria bacterium]|nr:LPS export ABC transporter ATP-binding protein [Gammaproteobacteria bacterium]MCY4275871.1 LPS export ABC transporter ATP-binding protein [Gammaproteobacteria bacterium]
MHLSIRNLAKRYKNTILVKDVSLDLVLGEIVGLLGPNGAGKTTSFDMIIGLIRPDSGSIMLDEIEISNMPVHERARRGIGYLAQEHSVFRKLTVEQNIMAVLEGRKQLTKTTRHETCNRLMEEFGISTLSNQPAYLLSGGEQRRVEIARLLSLEPAFILLDEPFAGIDPIAVQDIQDIICDLKERGIGILITDHNVRETLGICDRAYILNNGMVLASGTPLEIMVNPDAKSAYLGDNFTM